MRRILGVAMIALLTTLVASCAPIQTPAGAGATVGETVGNGAFLTLNLDAGHPLDPLLFSVNGGGEVDAATLDPACMGYITTEPTLLVNWTGDADFVEVFFYSDHDPTLVIQKPDGAYLCADDANDQILDPVIEMAQPPHGQYKIWVGSYADDQLIPGFLALTTRPEMNVGTLRLEDLVKREAIPEVLPEHAAKGDAAAAMAATLPVEAQALSPADGPVTLPISAAGERHASDLEMPFAGCGGFIGTQPDFVFAWEGDAPVLNLFVEAELDTTLAVISAAGEVFCSDDAVAGENLNPAVVIENPPPGRYEVFVGRLQLEQPVDGQLTVSFAADTEPGVLTPDDGGN